MRQSLVLERRRGPVGLCDEAPKRRPHDLGIHGGSLDDPEPASYWHHIGMTTTAMQTALKITVITFE